MIVHFFLSSFNFLLDKGGIERSKFKIRGIIIDSILFDGYNYFSIALSIALRTAFTSAGNIIGGLA
jgi:hypothetical protein